MVKPTTKMIKGLLQKKLIKLIAYDKMHLFYQFGRSFCKELTELKDVLKGSIPRILMTATCTKRIYKSIVHMLNVKFQNFFSPIVKPCSIGMY